MKFDKRYNEIILEYSENQKRFQNMTIVIVPGSFKPPHKGHWDMIMEYAIQADKVLVLISNISEKAIFSNKVTQQYNSDGQCIEFIFN